MKKILGLDLGTTSIGWAVVETKNDNSELNTVKTNINDDRIGIFKDAVGVRIIPAEEMHRRFEQGQKLNDKNAKTPTAERRTNRGARRLNSRYKLRRGKLLNVLEFMGILPKGSFKRGEDGRWIDDRNGGKWYTKQKGKTGENFGEKLYELRDRAIREKIDLEDLGRIFLWFNQWRGYSSDRFTKEEKSQFDYSNGIIKQISKDPISSTFEDKEKKILKYHQFEVAIVLDEPIIEDEEQINEITGFIFAKELRFKQGDVLSFKTEKKEERVKKIVINSYYRVIPVIPNPTDWKFRLVSLNKTLSEWCTENNTVGSYFYRNFYCQKQIERIRTNIVNRNWYEDELKKIWKMQYTEHKEYFKNIEFNKLIQIAFKDEGIRNKAQNIKPENNEDLIEAQIRQLISNCIIYYQRPWQQAKNKGACRFEKILVKKTRLNKGTKQEERYQEYVGRTVIPRSHPLHQQFKIWNQINNVRLFFIENGIAKNLFDDENLELLESKTSKNLKEIKLLLYRELQTKKSTSWKSFVENKLKITVYVEGLSKGDAPETYFTVNYIKRSKKGNIQENPLKGNNTKVCLLSVLKNISEDWFDAGCLTLRKENENEEIITNLQLLWELIYDITESKAEKVAQNIQKHFPDFTLDECSILSKVQFDDTGMGQISAKAIRKLLPLMKIYSENETIKYNYKIKEKIDLLLQENRYEIEKNIPIEERLFNLREYISDAKARKRLSTYTNISHFSGLSYWEAAAVIYGQHSSQDSKKPEETNIEKLFETVKRNSVNNPVVEKIVNEAIKLCKEIYLKYGFDEVRIELSRELKASREEREQMWEGMNNNASKNERAKMMLRELMNDEHHSQSNLDTTNTSNINKIKIVEDVVAQIMGKAHEEKVKEYQIKEPSKADIKRYICWLEQNFKCPYTNQPMPLTDVFSRDGRVQIEHIIPKERYRDNSYSNIVITWKEINEAKQKNGNRTAYEFIVLKRENNTSITLANGRTVDLVPSEKWEEHVKTMFPKGRKQMNLLRKSIPEDPINRTMKDTQYISVLMKEKLGKIVGADKVWTTTGAITDMLRESWHLTEIMKELVRDRFENFFVPMGSGSDPIAQKINYFSERIDYETGEIANFEVFPLKTGESIKRLDNRHHALDAIIIACTKQQHIQYINSLNAQYLANQDNDEEKKRKYNSLKHSICVGESVNKFKTPWEKNVFLPQIKEALINLIVSHKNTTLLLSPTRHKDKNNLQPAFSIRGKLHKETNYGTMKLRKLKFFKLEDAKAYTKSLPDKEKKEFLSKNNWQFRPIDIGKISNPQLKIIIEDWLLNNDSNLRLAIQNLPLYKSEPLKFVTIYETNYTTNNPITKTTGIYDERILSKILYLNNFKAKIKKEITDIQNEYRKLVISTELYQNVIYDVRIVENKIVKWVELKNLDDQLLEKIDYGKTKKQRERKEKIVVILKNRLSQNDGNFKKAFEDVFTKNNLILLNESLLPTSIKTVRAFANTDDKMFEVKRKLKNGNSTFVELGNNFMVYVFGKVDEHREHRVNSKEREWDLLSFFDAFQEKIKTGKTIEQLYKKENIPEGYRQIFTLSNNSDVVFIRPQSNGKYKEYEESDLKDLFDWTVPDNNDLYRVKIIEERKKEVIKNLWRVTQFSKAGNSSINFRKLNIAKSLIIPPSELNIESFTDDKVKDKIITEINKIRNETEEKKAKSLEENIIPYNKELFENCIKVFVDKLGKRVVPYWEFKDGCWNNADARKLGF